MNKYDFFCGLAMFFCIALVIAACVISESPWFVWLIAIAANMAIMQFSVSSEKSGKELSRHEQHLRCARIVWNVTGPVGFTSVILGVMDGIFGSVILIVISLSVIWLSLVHFADKEGKFYWWLGWVITMSLTVVVAILEILSVYLSAIPTFIMGLLFILIMISLAVTLIIGIVLYIYPPIKELSDDIKEIRDTIKNSPLNNG
ncbi:MAG: hypothetical protein IJ532_02295 [Alphaproteobacteria bacterium]|nr:hypothetical protein [Alphaproteobacteria bacterium]